MALFFGLLTPKCFAAQASSQILHPEHSSGTTASFRATIRSYSEPRSVAMRTFDAADGPRVGSCDGEVTMERQIQIESQGRPVELTEFPRSIVLNTIVAMVGSLRGVDPDGEIRIVVKAAGKP